MEQPPPSRKHIRKEKGERCGHVEARKGPAGEDTERRGAVAADRGRALGPEPGARRAARAEGCPPCLLSAHAVPTSGPALRVLSLWPSSGLPRHQCPPLGAGTSAQAPCPRAEEGNPLPQHRKHEGNGGKWNRPSLGLSAATPIPGCRRWKVQLKSGVEFRTQPMSAGILRAGVTTSLGRLRMPRCPPGNTAAFPCHVQPAGVLFAGPPPNASPPPGSLPAYLSRASPPLGPSCLPARGTPD